MIALCCFRSHSVNNPKQSIHTISQRLHQNDLLQIATPTKTTNTGTAVSQIGTPTVAVNPIDVRPAITIRPPRVFSPMSFSFFFCIRLPLCLFLIVLDVFIPLDIFLASVSKFHSPASEAGMFGPLNSSYGEGDIAQLSVV